MIHKIPFKVEVPSDFNEWCLKCTYSGFMVYTANILDETTTLVWRVIEESWPCIEQTTKPDIFQLSFCVKLDLLHKRRGHHSSGLCANFCRAAAGQHSHSLLSQFALVLEVLLKSNISHPLSRFAFIHLSEVWSSAPKKSCLYQQVLIFL